MKAWRLSAAFGLMSRVAAMGHTSHSEPSCR
jgi:hypothetical protein